MQIQNIYNRNRTIYVFERDECGKQNISTINDFTPYYYEPDPRGSHISYDGTIARKIMVNNPREISKQRSLKSYESDLQYTKRFIIDRINQFEESPIKYIFLDIEILTKDLPDTSKAICPVSCITTYNSADDKYQTWYLGEWGVENENIMLEDFVEYIKTEAPDMLLAWNVDFDYSYLYNRINSVLNVRFSDAISPIQMSRGGKNNTYYPAGVSILDYLGMFEKITLGKKRSYALDYIAQEELGEEPWGSSVFDVLNEEVKQKNINDVRRMQSLEEKYRLITHFDEIRRFAKCLWEDLPSERVTRDGKTMVVSNNSKVIDMLVLQQAKELGIVLPKKPEGSEKQEFEGAYRDTLQTGVFYNLGKYDLSGAYLFAITDLCLDAGNIVREDHANDRNVLPIHVTDRKTQSVVSTYYVKQNSNALLPSLIGKLVTERNKYRELLKAADTNDPQYDMLDKKYKAMKSLVLSAWGVIGNQYFRLYDHRIASMITSNVRDLLRFVVVNIEQSGRKVAYIDTDSVFVTDEGENINKYLNDLIQEWSHDRFQKKSSVSFEYEGHFEKILLLAKCHYYGYLKTPKGSKKEIKGVEVKRSSSCKYEAKFQDALINKVLDKCSKNQIINWLQEEIKNLCNNPLLEVAFPCKIQGTYTKNVPIFVRAAENSKFMFKKFEVNRGELFHYIFIKPKGCHPTTGKPIDVIAIHEDTDLKKFNIEVDWDAVTRRIIYNKTNNIFDVLNWGNLKYALQGQTVLF